jgi:hypothetical protein
MRVDEAGRHDHPTCVDRSPGGHTGSGSVANEHDAVTLHTDVGSALGSTGAVDEGAIAQEDVDYTGLRR